MRRRVCSLAGVVCVAILAPPLAHADGASTTEEHRALMISGQVLQKEGKLLRAREMLASCAHDACGERDSTECEALRTFCEKVSSEVEREIPTARFDVRDDRGLPVRPDVFVLDAVGVPFNPQASVEIDPGAHVARALYAGRATETRFVVTRSSKNISVGLSFDLRTTVVRRPIPAPVWLLGALSLVSGALSVATGVYTVQGYGALGSCKPLCDSASRDRLQTTAYAADVAGIFAIASALAATLWFLARPSVRETRWIHSNGEFAP